MASTSSPSGANEDEPNNCHEVSSSINEQILAILCDEMGFGKLRAEKALYFTNNASLEAAIQWMSDHEEDEDIDDPLKIGPKLSKEEADQKALELQRKLREARQQREKEDSIEKERRRIQLGKQMLETQRKMEEATREGYLRQLQQERIEHEQEKRRQLELLKEDWRERFGDSPPGPGEAVGSSSASASIDPADMVASKKPREQVAFWIARLQGSRTPENAAALRTCVTTLDAYIGNATRDPLNPKYHRIRKDQPAFVARVMPFQEQALPLLNAVGFQDFDDGFLVLPNPPDGYLLGLASKYLKVVLQKLDAIANSGSP